MTRARRLIVVAAAPGGLLHADVVSNEGMSFPEETGSDWDYTPQCEPERWIDSGHLFQHVEPGCGGPPGGDSDRYVRPLSEFTGVASFFFEWRMMTDGDAAEIPFVAPASFVAGDFTPVSYHFTIARDQVRLIRDNELPIVFVDIEPGVAHTYRLELYGDEEYAWYIDDELADAGIPEGPYPTDSAVIAWRAQAHFFESTSTWDYIRLGGPIPPAGSGDFDSEGDVDLRDFFYFDECRRNGGPDIEATRGCLWADMDRDGDVDWVDFRFFQVGYTGACDPVEIIEHPPPSVTSCLGEVATLGLVAVGDELQYQWQFNGQDIPGATTNPYEVGPIGPQHEGEYRCVVTGECEAVAVSNVTTLAIAPDVEFVIHPTDVTVCAGDTIFLIASATGSPSYQWYHDGEPISGANTFYLSIAGAAEDDAGVYHVDAIGLCETVSSTPATVKVVDCGIP